MCVCVVFPMLYFITIRPLYASLFLSLSLSLSLGATACDFSTLHPLMMIFYVVFDLPSTLLGHAYILFHL